MAEGIGIKAMPRTPRNSPNPPGAPDPGLNRETHGIVALKKRVQRRVKRGREIIDRRCAAGQNAVAFRSALIEERGGADNLSLAELTLIELIARDVYFIDEIDWRIFAVMHKLRTTEKALIALGKTRNPKVIGILYGYRAPITRNLAANLIALGLEKPPPKVKTLQEIMSEDDEP